MTPRAVAKTFLYVLLVAIIARVFFIDTFSVKGDSMSQTINDGDYVIINRLAYSFSEPKRGDIVVVRPRDSSKKILKRIIGLPGERIVFEKDKIVIKEDRDDSGKILKEEYIKGNSTKNNGEAFYEAIDPLEYFVLGDNRDVSIDSRQLGQVDKWSIKGKVIKIVHF